jgi:hypothetical protein
MATGDRDPQADIQAAGRSFRPDLRTATVDRTINKAAGIIALVGLLFVAAVCTIVGRLVLIPLR